MKLIYNLGIFLYSAITILVSPVNHKARLLVRGRRKSFKILKEKVRTEEKYIWIHCASLGEFEQGDR
jgi:3-deoxy-D-manno-octulosonic-acid transferase